jgi:hypothetical protein
MGNVGQLMGLSGNADSNYLTNLGKVSRYEGTELDNRKKENLAALLQKAIFGKSPDEAYGRAKATGFNDFGGGLDKEALRGGKVQLQQQDIATNKKIAGLEDLILKNKRQDPRTFETGDAWLRKRAVGEQALSDTAMEEAANKIMLLRGQTPGMQLDASGRRRKEFDGRKAAESQAEIRYKEEQTNAVVALGKKRKEKLTKEIAKIADEILLKSKLNAVQVMEIKNRVLNAVAKLDQDNLTAADRRKLIKEQTNVQAQKVLEGTAKAGIAGNNKLISDAELKANPGKLANEKKQRTVKLADLEAKLAREGDAGKREKIKREIAEETMQPIINTIVDKAANQREVNKNTIASGRLTDQKIMNALTNMKSPSDKQRDRDLIDARTAKANRTSTGTSEGASDSGLMLLGEDGKPSNPNAGNGIMSLLSNILGGGGSAPPAVQSSSPATQSSSPNEILSGLKGQGTSGWKANQIKAFVQKVVAESGGTVTPQKALEILKISQQGN